MRISLYLPLLLSLFAARGLPGLSRRLAPSLAARALTVVIAGGGLGTLAGLALVAGAGLCHIHAVLEHSQLSPRALSVLDPVPPGVGAVAAALLAVALARLGHLLVRRARLARQTRRVAASVAAGELVVFTSTVPQAYAIAGGRGRAGRIVVSDTMLRLLDGPERQVLLAHERAHSTHRHHRYRALAEVAAAVNPLLGRVRDQIGFQLERWADEDAAGAVGNRRLTARSLAHAALATTGRRCWDSPSTRSPHGCGRC